MASASVDIVIPSFNYGRYLGDCIASVQTQSIQNLRILVLDNASTDESVQVARRFAAGDRRIEVKARRDNLGLTASFNEGIEWAQADFLMILCADDLLSPGSLARAVSIMVRDPRIVLAYGEDVHAQQGMPLPNFPDDVLQATEWRIWSGSEFIRSVCRNPEGYVAAGMVLVRTLAQKKAGHYRAELPHTDDLEMLLRLACLGSVAYTPTVQGIKRMHSSNRTWSYLANRTSDLVERVAAIESFFAHEGRTLPDAKRLRRLGLASIAERAYWCGVGDLVRRRPGARDLFKLAFRLNPVIAFFPPLRYFLRVEEPAAKIASIIQEAVGRRGKHSS